MQQFPLGHPIFFQRNRFFAERSERVDAVYPESFRDLCLAEDSEYRYAYDPQAPNDHRNGVDLSGAEAHERAR
jgi:hypothetical protein